MADSKQVSLIYTSRSQVNSSSFSVYNFDGLTLQTLQPTYRDQLLTIWNQYVVLGVTIDVKIVNKSTTIDAEVLRYHGDGYTVAGLTFNQALEYKHTKRQLLSTSGNQKVINSVETLWFQDYLPPKYWDDSRFWGTASAGPSYSTDRGYQHAIGIVAADGSSVVSATIDRRITFHVRFFTLAAITNSLSSSLEDKPPMLMGPGDDSECIEPEEIPCRKPGPLPKKSCPRK